MHEEANPVVIVVDGKPLTLSQRQIAELLDNIHAALERNLKELEILIDLLYRAEANERRIRR